MLEAVGCRVQFRHLACAFNLEQCQADAGTGPALPTFHAGQKDLRMPGASDSVVILMLTADKVSVSCVFSDVCAWKDINIKWEVFISACQVYLNISAASVPVHTPASIMSPVDNIDSATLTHLQIQRPLQGVST